MSLLLSSREDSVNMLVEMFVHTEISFQW